MWPMKRLVISAMLFTHWQEWIIIQHSYSPMFFEASTSSPRNEEQKEVRLWLWTSGVPWGTLGYPGNFEIAYDSYDSVWLSFWKIWKLWNSGKPSVIFIHFPTISTYLRWTWSWPPSCQPWRRGSERKWGTASRPRARPDGAWQGRAKRRKAKTLVISHGFFV